MEFKRKFGQRKRPNPKRGVYLVILLFIMVFLWMNAEGIINKLLG
ncbi:hypothetical protein [Polaribacter pacificus]|nr:hypothetical protein [Polaribacter pacificus]